MIVDVDFPDHWKTRMLVNLLGDDEAAPVYLLRLWAHCQVRRQSKFENLSATALRALCRFPGHANQLESSLVASGFVRRDDAGALVIVNWDEYNASLIANWRNGGKGGRPKKPKGNPNPNSVNPTETHASSLLLLPSSPELDSGNGLGVNPSQGSFDESNIEIFLAAWNATPGVLSCPDRFQLGRIDLLVERFCDPEWMRNYPLALQRFPLKAAPGPMRVSKFLEEDTVRRILQGNYDFDPKDKKKTGKTPLEDRYGPNPFDDQ